MNARSAIPGWELLSESDQARMTDMMRKHPPGRFMLGMRVSDYQPTSVEAELLSKWQNLYAQMREAELSVALEAKLKN